MAQQTTTTSTKLFAVVTATANGYTVHLASRSAGRWTQVNAPAPLPFTPAADIRDVLAHAQRVTGLPAYDLRPLVVR